MVGGAVRLILPAAVAFALLCLAGAAHASVAPPANDTQDNATVIDAMPFTDTLDTTGATIGPDDDAAVVTCGLSAPYPKSVWYRYSPSSDHDVLIDTSGTNYSAGVGVGTEAGCVTIFAGSGGFSAQSGRTYWIAVVDIGVVGAGGSLHISFKVNHAPVCEDVAISVQTGQSVDVPSPDCTDPDGDEYQVFIDGGPTHGVFDYLAGSYTPSPGFVGQDSMMFRAQDAWRAVSDRGLITIAVTAKPEPTPQPGPQPVPTPQPPRDLTAPKLDVTAPSELKLRDALRRGIRMTAAVDEGGRLVVRAFVDRRTARRLKIDTQARGDVVVGSLARDITAGRSTVKLRLSRSARRRMRSAARVKLRVVARITDPAGNSRTRAFRITLEGRKA